MMRIAEDELVERSALPAFLFVNFLLTLIALTFPFTSVIIIS